MTRLLLSLTPLAEACALIAIWALTIRYRQKREDRAAALRFERQVAQALAACRDEDEAGDRYLSWLEAQLTADRSGK